jgi:hypothetical protein
VPGCNIDTRSVESGSQPRPRTGVFAPPLGASALAGPIGVPINNAAVFSNDHNMHLNLVRPAFTGSAVLANDGGLA